MRGEVMTNTARAFAATQAETAVVPRFGISRLLARLFLWINQLLCGLHGHDEVLRFADTKVLLRCTSCGHESPGWEVGPGRPRLRFAGDATRHILHRPQMRIVSRRTA